MRACGAGRFGRPHSSGRWTRAASLVGCRRAKVDERGRGTPGSESESPAAEEESAEVVDEPTDIGSTEEHSFADETDPAYACEQDLAHEGH